MTDFERLLEALSGAGVEFILMGVVAATVHGSARFTPDIDVVYARARASVARMERSGIRGSRCRVFPGSHCISSGLTPFTTVRPPCFLGFLVRIASLAR
jgi:hypothetical protein